MKKSKAIEELQQKVQELFNKELIATGETSILMDQDSYDQVKKALKVPRSEVKKIALKLAKKKKGVVAPFRWKTRVGRNLYFVDANDQKFSVKVPNSLMHKFSLITHYDSDYSSKWRKEHPNYHREWVEKNAEKAKAYQEKRRKILAEDPVKSEARRQYMREYYQKNKK